MLDLSLEMPMDGHIVGCDTPQDRGDLDCPTSNYGREVPYRGISPQKPGHARQDVPSPHRSLTVTLGHLTSLGGPRGLGTAPGSPGTDGRDQLKEGPVPVRDARHGPQRSECLILIGIKDLAYHLIRQTNDASRLLSAVLPHHPRPKCRLPFRHLETPSH
jgi:hypothetical protein